MKKSLVSIRNRNTVLRLMCAFALCLLAVSFLSGNSFMLAFASGGVAENASSGLTTEAVGIIFKILRAICIVLGAFFVVFGVVKVAIAHANENPQDQSKALTMAAVGLVLVLLGSVVLNSAMESSISTLIQNAVSQS